MGRVLSPCSSSCKTKRANLLLAPREPANAGSCPRGPTLQQAACISLHCLFRLIHKQLHCTCELQVQCLRVQRSDCHAKGFKTCCLRKQSWPVLRRTAIAYRSADHIADTQPEA